ncbi:MAG: choline dehydrogenase [Psychrobacter glaciei]|jgi:choline dehydrogenase
MNIYDYVIVGGGSAGCVLAERLSMDKNISVCLIEAGPKDSHPAIHIPIGMLWMMFSKKLNWHVNTQSEKQLSGRKLFWPRGKTLGGSSSSNAMCYIRGHANDYDNWQSLGCDGWSYKDVLPYFKRSEDQECGADEYHGTGGPLTVSNLRVHNKLSDLYVDAGVQAGFDRNEDFNGAKQEGVGFFQVTQRDGSRCSTAKGYLGLAEGRKNLTVITGVQAKHILTESLAGEIRATGVMVSDGKQEFSITTKKEVLLSAGTIFSPHLLMLSGIGDKKELENKGITCIKHLPGVGKNLQDHLDVMLVNNTRGGQAYNLGFTNILKFPWHAARYFFQKKGMFTTNGAEGAGFIKSDEKQEVPDLQIHFTPAKLNNHGRNLLFMAGQGYSLHVCNLRPKSRGTLALASSNASTPPLVNANYLSHPEDLEKMIKGVKLGRKILSQDALKPYRVAEVLPGESIQSDAEIEGFVRDYAETIYHPVGTCKMGTDDMAVVDSTLRVKGVANLRVVDASIMPELVGGNTNAPTIMIAEKAADMIKKANLNSDE